MRGRIWGLICFCLIGWGTTGRTESVLTAADVATYRHIFQAQHQGRFQKADTLRNKLANKVLDGYVLYDRYFSPHYKTKKNEITTWLTRYGDWAVAPDVYALGKQKKATLPIPAPKGIFGGKAGTCSAVFRPEPIDLLRNPAFSYLSGEKRTRARRAARRMYRALNRGKTMNARLILESEDVQDLFSRTDYDSARTALAFSYFIDGMDDKALAYVVPALKRSGDSIPLAYWVAGLAAWRTEDYAAAATYFAAAAEHKKKYPLLEAGASVWAARSYLKNGDYERVVPYLERASRYPRLFYGILAMRLLAQDLGHVWDEPALPNDDVSADFSHPALERFYALQQVGKKDWAERELSQLYLNADDEAKGILLMISQQRGFASDLLVLTGTLGDGSTRYPAPNWTPKDGWKVDKALVYAFVRQESCFNKRAESAVGALGLMQIMPATGRELAQILQYPFRKQLLKEPEYNLSLGQNYLLRLMDMPTVGNNLMFLAVAYNAGPGNLNKWKKKMKCEDPLLFLESIPSRETRSFVERIVVNYWIYRNLMGQPLASLDTVAGGDWPCYQALECPAPKK